MQNLTFGSSSPIADQDDQLVTSSPEHPLASMVHKPAAKFPISQQIVQYLYKYTKTPVTTYDPMGKTVTPGTFAPLGRQRKAAPKPPASRPPRSLTPVPAPKPLSKAKGKKKDRSESDFEEGQVSEDLQPIRTIRLPARQNSSPATRQRHQDQHLSLFINIAAPSGATETVIRTPKKPKIVEDTSADEADGSQDEGSEPEPEPVKNKKTKNQRSKSKGKAKATAPAVCCQQQEQYRNAVHPGLAWAKDLQIPVVQNIEAFKHFETSLIQVKPVPQTWTKESRIFSASKIEVPEKFILSTDLPGFISTEVLKKMNFSAHTNCMACCSCISSTMKTECEGRGPGANCHVLESAPLIASQLNRVLILQENLEAKANMITLRLDHFDRELVVLRGMLRDVLRVLWQIEQANPRFKWTEEFLMKLVEIAGWTIAPTVDEAVELTKRPTTQMMRNFYPIYPDVANISCSRSADEVAYEVS
ncbi:hypothetical protein K435DRAFT_844819 [Dendrothele bispora CBS 962.96]|uniref:Uncharacterized protein n=1 Tax=Dendrothele bispora (strain CBS 962.96) TaxID=1314807 RepID=A0A4S8KYT5_DENBC|nr:hypothetical protein K435DRAFT_844819 [Dendrothele bispora CBS 962.96]